MVKIKETIVVEGKYDKNTLLQIVDATVLETSGFGVFHDKKQLELLRNVARKRGLIVFTDSDGAGLVIRNYLKAAIPSEFLKHAYVPDIMGKERRKVSPGKEGKLGVEGMKPEIILEALRRAGATFEEGHNQFNGQITKQDLMELGLSGGANASENRARLLQKLNFPANMSANSMLQALNLLYSLQELQQLMKTLENSDGRYPG